MRQLTLQLNRLTDRPVVTLGIIKALLDTGSRFPVWVGPKSIFHANFKAQLVKSGVQFTGFGGVVQGDLYKMQCFVFGSLIYPDLPVVVCDNICEEFDLILSATMFSGLIYEIDEVNHRLNVTIPSGTGAVRKLTISESGNRLAIACSGAGRSVSRINSFD